MQIIYAIIIMQYNYNANYIYVKKLTFQISKFVCPIFFSSSNSLVTQKLIGTGLFSLPFFKSELEGSPVPHAAILVSILLSWVF